MGYICGIFDSKGKTGKNTELCKGMCQNSLHNQKYSCDYFSYSKVDLAGGGYGDKCKPLKISFAGREYVIVFDGVIYNREYLVKELSLRGAKLKSNTSAELTVFSYIIWRDKCVNYLDGAFCFCIYDLNSGKLFIARDKFGVKPLYYTHKNNVFGFSSSPAALVKCGIASAKTDKSRLVEMFLLSPSASPHNHMFSDIKELSYGSFISVDLSGLKEEKYWTLSSKPITDLSGECALHTEYLLENSIRRCFDGLHDSAVIMSGGVDSSVIASVCSVIAKEKQRSLSTYSLEMPNERKAFVPTQYIPQLDDEFAVYMAKWLGTRHTVINCSYDEIESSMGNLRENAELFGYCDKEIIMLYLLSNISALHNEIVFGACSDIVFGGYLWLYDENLLDRNGFNWIYNPFEKIQLLRNSSLYEKYAEEYMNQLYKKYAAMCPMCDFDDEMTKKHKLSTYLTFNFHTMQTLARLDEISRLSGVEIMLPYANGNLFEYTFNVPMHIKYQNNLEKSLLRNAMSSYLPERILYRKKSPFPTCKSGEFTEILVKNLENRCKKQSSILSVLFDEEKIKAYANREDNTVWYGQGYSKNQLLSWLLQFDLLCEKYNVDLQM